MRSLHSLLFFRLNCPNFLSLSSLGRCSSPLSNFVPSSGFAATAPCPLSVGDPRTGCSSLGGVSQAQSRGGESPASACCPDPFVAQDSFGFLGCRLSLLAQGEFFINHHPQALLNRAALNNFTAHPVGVNISPCCFLHIYLIS